MELDVETCSMSVKDQSGGLSAFHMAIELIYPNGSYIGFMLLNHLLYTSSLGRHRCVC